MMLKVFSKFSSLERFEFYQDLKVKRILSVDAFIELKDSIPDDVVTDIDVDADVTGADGELICCC